MDDKLVDEGLVYMLTLGEMAGRVARRGSCGSWRVLRAIEENRAPMALRDF